MAIQVYTLAERPELLPSIWSAALLEAWPPFMLEDPVANLYFGRGYLDRFHEYALIGVDEDDPHTVVARAFSVPFLFGGPGRTELPDGGWDTLILWANSDTVNGRAPNAVSAIEIVVHPAAHGRGLSHLMVDAMRQNVRRLGYADLYAPVRPSQKHIEPLTPMEEYAFRTREDGLPADSWLRVHTRAGGRIVKIASRSMTIAGTLAEWRQWSGLPFDRTGDAIVPGALCPVHVAVEHDHAVYVEPNVWMHHAL